jgi:hypothetical protein
MQVLERYRSLQNIIAILGEGELSEAEKITVGRAKKMVKFFSQPFLHGRTIHQRPPANTLTASTPSTGLKPSSPANTTNYQTIPSIWWAPSKKP